MSYEKTVFFLLIVSYFVDFNIAIISLIILSLILDF